MFDRIVVPVDGSELAETVFPYVRLFKRAFGSSVRLLQAIDVTAGLFSLEALSVARSRDVVDAAQKSAEQYLSAAKKQIVGADQVTGHGAAVDVITEESGQDSASTLIAMSTHGRSGIGRWIIGSVTDKVVHAATNSMLVVRPAETAAPTEGEAVVTRIILPLDGSELSETAIPLGRELARRLDAGITLVRAVSTVQIAMAGEWPASYPDMLQEVEDEARDYLGNMEGQLLSQCVGTVDTQMVRGDAAAQIVDLARQHSNSLVVMTSRGRSGLGRSLLGSVADRVVCSSAAPVLLVRT